MARANGPQLRSWKQDGKYLMEANLQGMEALEAVAVLVGRHAPVANKMDALDPEGYVAWRRAWLAGVLEAIAGIANARIDRMEERHRKERLTEFWRLRDLEVALQKEAAE